MKWCKRKSKRLQSIDTLESICLSRLLQTQGQSIRRHSALHRTIESFLSSSLYYNFVISAENNAHCFISCKRQKKDKRDACELTPKMIQTQLVKHVHFKNCAFSVHTFSFHLNVYILIRTGTRALCADISVDVVGSWNSLIQKFKKRKW